MTREFINRNAKKSASKKPGFNWRNAMSTTAKVAQTAGTALSIARTVYGIVNAEKKFYTNSNTGTENWNGSVYPISNLAAGDDVADRDGNSVLAKHIYVNANIGIHASATQTSCRIIVFQDRFNTGSDPTVVNILNSTYVGNAYAPLAPINVDTITRYKVLYNRRFTLSSAGTKMIPVKIFHQFKRKMHIRYTGTTSSDKYNNQLYILVISDEQTNAPTVTWVSRLGFYDN